MFPNGEIKFFLAFGETLSIKLKTSKPKNCNSEKKHIIHNTAHAAIKCVSRNLQEPDIHMYDMKNETYKTNPIQRPASPYKLAEKCSELHKEIKEPIANKHIEASVAECVYMRMHIASAILPFIDKSIRYAENTIVETVPKNNAREIVIF